MTQPAFKFDSTCIPYDPGCTSIVALVWGSQLFVANAGDCRAVLSR